MFTPINLRGKKTAVLGLGIEGKDLVKFLIKNKAQVTVFDQKPEKEINFEKINKSKIKLITGSNYLTEGFKNYDYLFRSPGVYRYKPELIKAQKEGVVISSAIKLFFDLCPGKIIGVTGTKGKGTTSTIIYKILKKEGRDVFLAGNIGKPYLELLPKLTEKSWIILEMSSFQLIDLHKSPDISVVLNITSDHLDWHRNIKEYIDAKKNIVKHQKSTSFSVVNADHQVSKSFANHSQGKAFFFSTKKAVRGAFVKNNKIYLSTKTNKQLMGDVNKLKLIGKHNWENVTAAICAAKLAGASIKSIKEVIFSFSGLEHRLEKVGKIKNITFYNDSFSTNPEPTIAAVNSFKEPLTLILGGFDKGLNYEKMAKVIAKKKNVKNIILIGQTRKKIKNNLTKAGFKGKTLDLKVSKMKKIIKTAFQITPEDGVVILSPASASFDMFTNYKERGKKFKEEVEKLNITLRK